MNKLLFGGLCLLIAAGSCDTPGPAADLGTEAGRASVAAWATIYGVLQHPRCANCHPDDRTPMQGDDMRPHAQNIQGGSDGRGRFGLHCDACHRTTNLGAAPQPPGAPNWRMPTAELPLVFAGRTPAELCNQLKDPERNGGRTMEELFHHMSEDPLVRWGWTPGEGRTPVSTSHEELVQAMRIWIDNGCGCPK